MFVPLSWLREFTPYEGTAQELGDRLTMLGLELEDIVNPFANIENIVVGFVAECRPHPDSDHMHCCKVDIGTGEILDIVCGAPNIAQGQKVAVARVGTKLPDGSIIKKAKLRGQPSYGMICSERELGLSDDHSGIMVLPESADVGHKLVDALYLDTEVLDLSVTPNRGDCLSILGIARETAIAWQLPLHVPEIPIIQDMKLPAIDVPVEISSPALCWLYSGRVITNVKVQPSSMRLRYRLLAVGIRPISNIVDITNYVLYEVGQPLHAFDLDKVEGQRIMVRPARKGENLVTLDGRDRTLEENDLCICDAKRIIGLAGVMGGQNTEITDQTTSVFIESAVFNPVNIRKTSRRLGLVSEASFRFERGIDERRSVWALDRSCALMQSIGGGIPVKSFTIAEPKPFIPLHIPYNPQTANKLLGVDLDAEFQRKALNNVGCALENTDSENWIAIQPSWRHDLLREADLIEETGRIYGLDRIEPKLPCTCKSLDDLAGLNTHWDFLNHIRRWAAGIGLNEIINYSFTSNDDLDFLSCNSDSVIKIKNPLSDQQNVLRPCLAPGLLHSLTNNLAFGAQSIKLFEIANVFEKDSKSETGAREEPMLGLLLYGLRNAERWPYKVEIFDYVDLKGLLENLFYFAGLPEGRYEWRDKHPWFSLCVEVFINNINVATMGQCRKDIAQKYNAQKPIWMAECNLSQLALLRPQYGRKFTPLAVYPGIRRDITVIAGEDMKAGAIMEKIAQLELPLLEDFWLTDIYNPEGGKEKNFTFRLSFRHPDRTLKDAEADKEREKVADFLKKNLDVKI